MLDTIKKNYKLIALGLTYTGLYVCFGPGASLIFLGLHCFVWGTTNSKCY
jgi:hypothetical protein